MDTGNIAPSLAMLLSELTLGAKKGSAFVLNGGDSGMLASLDRLSAAEASQSHEGGATIAAHVDHVAYSLSLVNRWAEGEANPWADADWSAAWRTTSVDDARWSVLLNELRGQVMRWRDALAEPRDVQKIELDGMIASIVHLAYHLGAIRQIVAKPRGPKDGAATS